MNPGIAICSRSYESSTDKKLLSVEQVLRHIKSLGVNVVDLLAKHVSNEDFAKHLRSIIENEGMNVVNYSTRLTAVSALAPKRIGVFEQEFSKAAIMHSPSIGIRISSNEDVESGDVFEKAVEGYGKLMDIAKKYYLTILIENVKSISQNPDVVLGLSRRYNDFVFPCIDTGNFPINQRYTSISKLASLAKHCHFKTLSYDANGQEESIDTEACIYMLTKQGFKGFIAVEYEGGENEEKNVEKGIILLRKNLNNMKKSVEV
jgi:sugar phosphate isomerase/epimerase